MLCRAESSPSPLSCWLVLLPCSRPPRWQRRKRPPIAVVDRDDRPRPSQASRQQAAARRQPDQYRHRHGGAGLAGCPKAGHQRARDHPPGGDGIPAKSNRLPARGPGQHPGPAVRGADAIRRHRRPTPWRCTWARTCRHPTADETPIQRFVAQMNALARKLGMQQYDFRQSDRAGVSTSAACLTPPPRIWRCWRGMR